MAGPDFGYKYFLNYKILTRFMPHSKDVTPSFTTFVTVYPGPRLIPEHDTKTNYRKKAHTASLQFNLSSRRLTVNGFGNELLKSIVEINIE